MSDDDHSLWWWWYSFETGWWMIIDGWHVTDEPIVKNHMVIVSTILSAWMPVSHLNNMLVLNTRQWQRCDNDNDTSLGQPRHSRSRCQRGRRRSPRPTPAWWRGRRWASRWSPLSSRWTRKSGENLLHWRSRGFGGWPSMKLWPMWDLWGGEIKFAAHHRIRKFQL